MEIDPIIRDLSQSHTLFRQQESCEPTYSTKYKHMSLVLILILVLFLAQQSTLILHSILPSLTITASALLTVFIEKRKRK